MEKEVKMVYKLRGTITTKRSWKTYAGAKRNLGSMRRNSRVRNVRVVKK
jgi:hypothetical protein